MRAVILCCPSMRMRLPAEWVPSLSLTVGLRHAIRYPMGYPRYSESMRFRTLVASHTKGR